MERFKLWLAENSTATGIQVVEELRSIQTMASLRPADRIIIFLGAVFTETAVTKNEVEFI
jgi:hypothetical protein